VHATDEHWRAWGERDPYFAVLSDPRFRGRPRGEVLAEFFASGEAHIARILAVIRSRLDERFAPRSALDFGCGVGRTTIPLARLCPTLGVDVSEAMLEEARRNAAAAGVEARFTHDITGEHDLVHSVLVFQHIPMQRGLPLARRLLECVGPRGVAALHFVYRSDKRPLATLANRLRHRFSVVHYATNVFRRRPLLDPPMQMNPYALDALLELFSGFTLHVESLGQRDYPGFLFYARRP
jgi:trans-aconitate methyltransferase